MGPLVPALATPFTGFMRQGGPATGRRGNGGHPRRHSQQSMASERTPPLIPARPAPMTRDPSYSAALPTDLASQLHQWPMILAQVETFGADLRRRNAHGSSQVALATAKLLRNMVATCCSRDTTADVMITLVTRVAKELLAAQPAAVAIGNIARRVLHIIRDEAAKLVEGGRGQRGLRTLLGPKSAEYGRLLFSRAKTNVIERVNELVDEFSGLSIALTDQSLDHIHDNDVILTFGKSRTVENFLVAALQVGKRKAGRHFEVIVAEAAPDYRGHQQAHALATAGVPTTVINDAAVFAAMPRVTKVIVSAHAVMASGGIIAQNGIHIVALAAKHHSVPLICVSPLYKLCPVFPFDQDSVNDFLSPSAVLKFEEIEDPDLVRVLNPAYDYVPPELVSLFVTDNGGAQPSYIYRLLAENYSREDDHLDHRAAV